MKTAAEIRKDFIDFFRSLDHEIVKSAPVIPISDPTLLFTNAGMNQFKPIFLDLEKPVYKRIANSQKCIRVSGKHNDLEEVGKDTYHHTFFEMLGNWSFGDYYKREAIRYAWTLFTEVWKFPKTRLWATIYQNDDEAYECWRQVTDIDPKRILRFGEKDNFWEMGETGPCGPCSEIHYYTGDEPDRQSAECINADNPEYIELWNLVFIQYNRDEQGKLHPLSRKHVDTGAGLERIVAAHQQKKSNYDTDLFTPLIRKIEELTKVNYHTETGMPHRVISDHVRMLTFAIADGGMPANDGRGYVIRRILRRAARFGRMLNMHQPFIYQLVDTVGNILGDVYPEIIEHKEHIRKVIRHEEQSFGDTLDKGLEVYQRIKAELTLQKRTEIPGTEVFKLYDTFGFPLDLTQLIAREDGLTVDLAGFHREMDKQKERARAAQHFKRGDPESARHWIVVTEGEDSEFVGYVQTATQSIVRRYYVQDDTYYLVLDKTPFYAESGGEIGDTGIISNSEFSIEVSDTQKTGNTIVHIGRLTDGKIGRQAEVRAEIDVRRSDAIRANHTATHLLHAALREVLGEHVHQAGSLVEAGRLRFDFTHYTKVTSEELERVEDIVNRKILENIEVDIQCKSFDEAKKSGAMALFGEKYDDIVRVINLGDFSRELCGGKHVERTGDIGGFKIISESAVAAGIRRIEAVTGQKVFALLRQKEHLIREVTQLLNTTPDQLPAKIQEMHEQLNQLEKKLQSQAVRDVQTELNELLEQAKRINDLTLFHHQYTSMSMDELKQIADLFRERVQTGVALLISKTAEKLLLVVCVSDAAIQKYSLNAGQIVKRLGEILGGGGGGRPHLATAGGKDFSKIPEAVAAFENMVREHSHGQ